MGSAPSVENSLKLFSSNNVFWCIVSVVFKVNKHGLSCDVFTASGLLVSYVSHDIRNNFISTTTSQMIRPKNLLSCRL